MSVWAGRAFALAATTSVTRQRANIEMKGAMGYRRFNLDMWYGNSVVEQHEAWISPWASAHKKLRQQELEIEQCEFLLQNAIDDEDFGTAQGLQERVERLRGKHPIRWREERLEEALADGNFELAAIFQRDIEAVRQNLGLPMYNVGQAIVHKHRQIKGIVIDIDLVCRQDDPWIYTAGCVERAHALGHPVDEVCDTFEIERWRKQPFYTVLPDVRDAAQAPPELSAWVTNRFSKEVPPIYLAEEACTFFAEDEDLQHPLFSAHFAGHDLHPHRGRQYRPTQRLRLWQQQLLQVKEEQARKLRTSYIGRKVSMSDVGWNGD